MQRSEELPPGMDGIAAANEPRPFGLWPLCGLALGLGIFTGFGAIIFRGLIGFIHNVMFLGRPVFEYDASVFTPASPWGAFVILVPVVGSIGVTFIVRNFAPEAKGHGVPEVMDAVYYGRGIIRPVVAAAKSIASALAIGSGAAVGREGPIIQIGSALGSTLGQVIAMPAAQRITLVAAGGGAGIAATFNTPIGGVLFAIELMLPEISVNTFLPVALATGSATFIGRLFFGAQPAFMVPVDLAALPNQPSSAVILVLYAVLGGFMGLAAAGFVRTLVFMEEVFDRLPGSYLRHALGMLAVGVLIQTLFSRFGHYYVEGVGYSTIQAVLAGQLTGGAFLLVLFVAKLLATTLSLGSGSSGGIFSPSLYMGATLGGAFAELANLSVGMPVSVAAFAMVGMGAMVGGGTGAAMTAVTMIFEMTRDYNIVLPMILAVAMSLGTRRIISRENIYTIKLARRGHAMPRGLHANLFLVRSAREVMLRDFAILDFRTTFAELLSMSENLGGLRHVIVARGRRILGVLRVNMDMRRAIGAAGAEVTLGELTRRNFVFVRDNQAAFDVIVRMRRRRASVAVVISAAGSLDANEVLGVITEEQIAASVADSISLYPR